MAKKFNLAEYVKAEPVSDSDQITMIPWTHIRANVRNFYEVADVAVANIIADVIIMMSAPIMKHIRPGGIFICSGIAREREYEVIDALNEAGYQNLDVRNQGEWAAIASIRP